jgi:hypothetical protein
MNTSIHARFSFGLTLCLVAVSPSPVNSAGRLGDLGVGPDSDSRYLEPAIERIESPIGRSTIRVIDPEDGEQVGTIRYGIPPYGSEPLQKRGGPR